MKKIPLQIRRVHIREAPGIGSGLDSLDGLSPGINVIYGPNGSGKSTTLRLMQASLSSGTKSSSLRRRGDRVETVVDLAGSTSTIVLRDLEPVPTEGGIPEVGSELVRDCRFSLRELMEVAGSGDYGRLFTEAAAGGLNLVQLANSLKMGDRSRPRPTDRKQLDTLRRKLVDAENEVAKVVELKRQLDGLESERGKLESGSRRLHVLRDAIRHRGNLTDVDTARRALEEFPTCMGALDGGELGIVETAGAEISEARGALKAARIEWHREIRKRRESGLTRPLATGTLKYLDEKKEKLDDLEQSLVEVGEDLCKADSAMQTAQDLLGEQIPQDFLKTADAPLLAHLEAWCDRVEEHQGNAAAVAELEKNLGNLSPPPASGAAEDIQRLRDWLAAERAQGGSGKLRNLLAAAAILVLIVSVVLGFVVHPVGFSGVLGAVCLGLAWLFSDVKSAQQCRKEVKERCQRSPQTWTRPAVNSLLVELEQQLAEELEIRQRITRWAPVLNTRKSEIEAESRKLSEDSDELGQRLGFVPRLGRKCFGMVAKAMIDWQIAHRASTASATASEKVTGEIEDLRNSILPKLGDFRMLGVTPDFDSAMLAGWISDLRDLDQQFRDAGRGMDSGRGTVSRILKDIRGGQKRINDVYLKIGSDEADYARLNELLGRWKDFRDANQRVDEYGQVEREARKFFEEYQDLTAESLDDLNSEMESLGNPDGRLAEVNQDRGEIRGRLQDARRSTAVEERRIEFDNRRTELLGERERMLASVAGLVIAEQVQRKVASETVPIVQRRAGELLREFTRGACDLIVENGNVRALQASETQRPFELHELSDGTRVQLFIAIRLAFVEQGEQGWQLPLFFDEAFANSDDERGRKIMDALAAISKQGRQVFYFTSQAAEYGRWAEVLANLGDCESSLLPLRKAFGPPNVQAQLNPPERYPEPLENESYWQYAERIGVSKVINPWISSADEVPLVHVLDNSRDLRNLLESGVQGWGTLARLGVGECGLKGGGVAFQMARKRAEFLFGVCGLWQRGRGRPITREHLSEAGATNTPKASRLEDMWKHAMQFGRDAKRLCEALEQKEISVAQLGPKIIANLREICEEKGLIAPDEPIGDGEIRLRSLNLGRSLGLPGDECDRLLDFLQRPGNGQS